MSVIDNSSANDKFIAALLVDLFEASQTHQHSYHQSAYLHATRDAKVLGHGAADTVGCLQEQTPPAPRHSRTAVAEV